MDQKKAKITLGKLNVLFNSLEEAGEDISPIEKDLMLNYIKQLYEAVLDTDQIAVPVLPVKETLVEKTVSKTKDYIPSETENNAEDKEEIEVQEVTTSSVEAVTEINESEEDELSLDEDLMNLFMIEEATELSQKLSLIPIKDLKKSMGINEKIFTVKELFNGDQKLFDECLEALNGFNNFEDAKKFLAIGPAQNFDWSEKSKQKKAKTFIKLVHRRYQ